MKRLLLIFVICSASCGFAAVTDTCSGTTACNFSGSHKPGDLAVYLSYRAASATAPSNPAGLTSVTSGSSATGANRSWRISCQMVSATGTLNSGTFTNGTNTVGVTISGTAVVDTASCNTVGIKTIGTANSVSSATATYSALTVATAANYVLGLMGSSTSGNTCTPTGMTSQIALGDARISLANATGNWSTTTCSITSSVTTEIVIEIVADPVPAACSGTCPTSAANDVSWIAPQEETGNSWVMRYPNPVGSNNLKVCKVSYPSASTLSITDGTGDSWTQGTTLTSAAKSVKTDIWYKAGATAGVTALTFALTSAGQMHAQCHEFYNVSTSTPVDVTFGSSDVFGTGLTVALPTGSNTTTVDNDLVIYAEEDLSGPLSFGGVVPTNITGFYSHPGWVKLDGDPTESRTSSYLVWGSHGAINPSMTLFSSNSDDDQHNVIGIAFKAASAGTAPPTGMRINNLAKMQMSANASAVYLFSCPNGNLLAYGYSNPTTNDNVTAITDSINGAWTKLTDVSLIPQFLYKQNATGSADMLVTFTHSAISPSANQTLWCISGAATSAFDTTTTASGTAPNGGNFTGAPQITPAGAGLIIGILGMDTGPSSAALSPVTYANVPYTAETDIGHTNSGDAAAYYYNPGTSLVDFGYTVGTVSNLSPWHGRAVSFLAPAAPGGTCTNFIALMGAGCK